MTNAASVGQGRIRELDGWRGVSILLVVVYHLSDFTFPGMASRSKLLDHVLSSAGGLGVNIFFVVSGFVITRLLVAEEREFGSVSLKGFYTRRFFRILPVFYFFVLAISAMSQLGWTPVELRGQLASIFFYHDLDLGFRDWFLGHSWSLSVEEQFYIVFPLFWILAPRRLRTPVLLGTLAVLLVWGAVSRFGIGGSLFSAAIIGFSCINVGALLAMDEARVRRQAARAPMLAALAVFALLVAHPATHSNISESLYGVFVPFGAGLTLMFSIAKRSWISAVLKTPVLQWCGLVSYSGYLWQELFTGASSSYGGVWSARGFHLGLPLLPLVAWISYRWIEKPCTRLGRRISQQVTGRKPQDAAAHLSAL